MAGLTKTQINYLENKLSRAVSDKIDNFKKELGEGTTLGKEILKRLKAGEIKFISDKDLIKLFDDKISNGYSWYNPTASFDELISQADRDKIQKELDKRESKINEYSMKLSSAKQNALDKIVLEGVAVEVALAELDKVK